MNAVLHNKATIKIMAGNTFSDPQFIKMKILPNWNASTILLRIPLFLLKTGQMV